MFPLYSPTTTRRHLSYSCLGRAVYQMMQAILRTPPPPMPEQVNELRLRQWIWEDADPGGGDRAAQLAYAPGAGREHQA